MLSLPIFYHDPVVWNYNSQVCEGDSVEIIFYNNQYSGTQLEYIVNKSGASTNETFIFDNDPNVTPYDTLVITNVTENFGVYFTYDSGSNCPINEEVYVNVSKKPNAGEDGVLNTIVGDLPTDEELFNALEGNPDNNGDWSTENEIDYLYIVPSVGGCLVPDTAKVVFDNTFLSVTENNLEEVNCYPNPFNDELTIQLSNKGSYTIRLFDLNGKMLIGKEYVNTNEVILNMIGIPKGVYLIKVTSLNYAAQKRIIK